MARSVRKRPPIPGHGFSAHKENGKISSGYLRGPGVSGGGPGRADLDKIIIVATMPDQISGSIESRSAQPGIVGVRRKRCTEGEVWVMSTGETILIIDDARLARQMVRSFVGHTRPDLAIFEAAEAAEALRVLDGMSTVTFTTIDYNMPGMNGLELAAIIRERFPAARIALLTANVQSALRLRAAAAGLDFIDKPINENKIAAFVGRTDALTGTGA